MKSYEMIAALAEAIAVAPEGRRRICISGDWHDLGPDGITALRTAAESHGWDFERVGDKAVIGWARGLPPLREVMERTEPITKQ